MHQTCFKIALFLTKVIKNNYDNKLLLTFVKFHYLLRDYFKF